MLDIVGLVVTALILGFIYLRRCYQYWEDRKIPHVKAKSLLFGNNFELALRRISFQKYHADLYNDLAPHRFGGYYSFQRPFLLIRDPELIKHVLTVDFQKFNVRHSDADGYEPLRLHLFNLHGDAWKVLRDKLSPAFSPAKIRLMTELMKECAVELVDVLKKPAEENTDVFITDLAARYSTDVTSTCAFGFRAHTLSHPDAVFRKMSIRIIQPHIKYIIRSLMLAISPKLCGIFKIRMFDPEAVEYFLRLVDETIKHREKNNVVRNDFIDLLIAIKKEEEAADKIDKNRPNKIDVSVENLAAQCFAFFFASFTTQNLGSALMELARNPDIQAKLRQEVDEAFEANNGDINYDAINKMKYIDQVLSETIRSYPGLPALLRQCTENYKIPDSDCIIEKGVTVFIPRYGLNHDPKYYPDPETFDPEHFSDEAKAARHPYAHLLFGDGPRKCLGMRFGLMQSKLALSLLIRNYEFLPSPKMKFPLKYTSNVFVTTIVGGVWIRCKKRNHN